MIYVIYDTSFEWDDLESSSKTVYVGTDKDKAIEHFEHYYRCYDNLSNEKWVYGAMLIEYPDGWNKIDCQLGNLKDNVILTSTNTPDTE